MTTAARRPIATSTTRRRFLAAASAGLAAWGASARAWGADAAAFPAAIVADFNGRAARLALTGTALRMILRVRVYTVASYAPEGVAIPSPEALAALDAPKLLLLVFDRAVDGATLAKSFRESIGRGNPAPAFAGELALLEQHFVANPVQKGDRVALTHVPGVGLGVRVNDGPGLIVPGVAFARAAWGTYFGPNKINVALQDGLTSRLR